MPLPHDPAALRAKQFEVIKQLRAGNTDGYEELLKQFQANTDYVTKENEDRKANPIRRMVTKEMEYPWYGSPAQLAAEAERAMQMKRGR